MSVSIALVCEGATDPPTVCALADRVILNEVAWLRELADEIDTHRHYRGFRPTDEYMTWFDIDKLAALYRVKSRGHFEGLPLHGDGHNVKKALTLLTLYAPEDTPVEAVIFFRDGDKEYDGRREAIRRVRDSSRIAIPVVVGIANRMRECWILNGFDPAESERERFDAEHERIGFDPRDRAHDLTATNIGEDRCPKRVLRELTGDDRDRERLCVFRTPLETLQTRGVESGLKDFLDELEARLISAFR